MQLFRFWNFLIEIIQISNGSNRLSRSDPKENFRSEKMQKVGTPTAG